MKDDGIDALKGFISKETLLREYPELTSEGRVRWWVRHRHTNGAAGAIMVVGRRAFFNSERMLEWLRTQDRAA